MKRWRNLSLRGKMITSSMLIVLVVVVVTALMMAASSSQLALESNRQSLSLITEQALNNFTASMDSLIANLYSTCAASGTPAQLYKMRNMDPNSNEYLIASRDLTNTVWFVINDSTPFDGLSILPDNSNTLFYSRNQDDTLIREAEEVYSDPEARAIQYGTSKVYCLQDGSVWIVRDVYNPSPLRHVGKIAARVKKDRLINISQENLAQQYTLLFYNPEGRLMLCTDAAMGTEVQGAFELLYTNKQGTFTTEGGNYAVSVQDNGEWICIGLQPMTVLTAIQNHLWRNALLALCVGLVLAFVCTMLVSHSLTSGIVRLNESLDSIAAGNLDAEVPVKYQDEIGKLTEHFNATTKNTKELLNRLVQEEANKRHAEFMNLEYEYRFLQWQINPHFIYNALETLNGLAKIDGNDELCNMIMLLSGYFRHNAETMRSKFVTVRQELRSLRQYVDIYRQIYGSTLDVVFRYDEQTGKAYLPTMIVQPLLENALLHGVSPQREGRIEINAEILEDRLQIRIEDNGPGMSEETILKILGTRNDHPANKEEKTSLGVRNVLDRLKLLYGDQAELVIESVLGEGTRVRMAMPLSLAPPMEAEEK